MGPDTDYPCYFLARCLGAHGVAFPWRRAETVRRGARRKRHPTGDRNLSQTGGAQAHPRREGKGPGGLWGSRKYPITLRGVRRVSEPDVTAASIPPTPLLLLPSLPATSPLRPPLGLAAREATHSTGGFARVDPGQHFLVQINKWPSVWKHRPAFPGEVTRVRPLKVCRRPALPGSSPRAGPRRPGEGEPVPDQRPFRGWALTPPRGQRVQELQRLPLQDCQLSEMSIRSLSRDWAWGSPRGEEETLRLRWACSVPGHSRLLSILVSGLCVVGSSIGVLRRREQAERGSRRCAIAGEEGAMLSPSPLPETPSSPEKGAAFSPIYPRRK
ncbi:uncharacterized protein LOC115838552 [Nomascus leucogenys]|uniref:uncharacterized protein LOC115838552 n=1 Tax=Nomascus leucogenys TaxID=61853 RepID=UPI00122DA74D|nr:uncharacterized protein LOC115838552 [Nomascus leucogenys]